MQGQDTTRAIFIVRKLQKDLGIQRKRYFAIVEMGVGLRYIASGGGMVGDAYGRGWESGLLSR